MDLAANKSLARPGRVWFVLGIPPLLFLVVIIAASVYFGMESQGDANAIPERVAGATPYLLLGVQILLLGLLVWTMRAEKLSWTDLGWRLGANQKVWREVALGVLVGIPLGLVYIFVLAPFMSTVQRVVGDYVPPDQLLSSLGSAALPFFLANVLLAPFVEENIYRGYGISRLQLRYRVPVAALISCVFFGLLHWTGGFWYIVLTGSVAGGILAGLFVWRKSIVAAYSAHLALNLVEFLLVWQLQ